MLNILTKRFRVTGAKRTQQSRDPGSHVWEESPVASNKMAVEGEPVSLQGSARCLNPVTRTETGVFLETAGARQGWMLMASAAFM